MDDIIKFTGHIGDSVVIFDGFMGSSIEGAVTINEGEMSAELDIAQDDKE